METFEQNVAEATATFRKQAEALRTQLVDMAFVAAQSKCPLSIATVAGEISATFGGALDALENLLPVIEDERILGVAKYLGDDLSPLFNGLEDIADGTPLTE